MSADIHDVDILVPPTYEPSGETQDIVTAIRSGSWLHLTNLWLWRLRPDGSAQILFQQRDANSPFAPNLLDCSVGGYLMAGESGQDGGLREMEEELSIIVPVDQLHPLGRHFNAGLDQRGRERRRVINSYALHWQYELSDLKLSPDEVPAAYWVSCEGLLSIEQGGQLEIVGITTDGEQVKRTVTNQDFVYNVDRLHFRIAEQIERLATSL